MCYNFPMDNGDEPVSFEKFRQPDARKAPMELFSEGKFPEMRDALGTRGRPDEMHYLLNFLRALSAGTAKMPPGHVSRTLVSAEPGSLEFYKALFQVLREAGFTDDARPAIENYFAAVREHNGPRALHGLIGEEAEELERQEALRYEMQNALAALDATFPREKRSE